MGWDQQLPKSELTNTLLKKHVDSLICLDNDEWNDISSYFHEKIIRKKDFFVRAGEVCQELGFINRGLFKVYQLQDEEEVVGWIAAENIFISELTSFISREVSIEYIEALEDSEISVITFEDMQLLYHRYDKWQEFGRVLIEQAFIGVKRRIASFIYDSAEERYGKLAAEDPALIERVPLKDIASYLGIKPETLSRIRRKVLLDKSQCKS